jgi:UDP-2,3-diacylglucosamine pyrophosphatase LpxH
MVVVISDVHLGDQRSLDDGYVWCKNNRTKLISFLNNLIGRPAVKEIVIAGDFFDEWVAPMEYDTFDGLGSDKQAHSQFLDRIAAANQDVIDAMNEVIQSGIKVTYVPGNHDMFTSQADISRIFPGMHYSSDVPGLGAYSPAWLPSLVVEHGHRYDFFNAPDMFSNKEYTANPNSLLPPGFFVSKVATSYGVRSTPAQFIHEVNEEMEETGERGLQYNLAWKTVLGYCDIFDPWNPERERKIKTGIDGYTDEFTINQLADYNPDLYKNIESQWRERQRRNNVVDPTTVITALLSGPVNTVLDMMAEYQYFDIDKNYKRVAVFGHTHEATLKKLPAGKLKDMTKPWRGKYKVDHIYANAGTWVDHGDPACTFVVVEPVSQGINVGVYKYNVTDNGGQLVHSFTQLKKDIARY